MRSYRFARRSFLASIGGAFGLRIMLDDFEAMAQGATSPPRFLMTHWPVGHHQVQVPAERRRQALGCRLDHRVFPDPEALRDGGPQGRHEPDLGPPRRGQRERRRRARGRDADDDDRHGLPRHASERRRRRRRLRRRTLVGSDPPRVRDGRRGDRRGEPEAAGHRLRERDLRRAHRFAGDLHALPLVRLPDAADPIGEPRRADHRERTAAAGAQPSAALHEALHRLHARR